MALRTPAFNDAKTYGFEWLRYLAELASLQEGVIGANDLKVTAAAAGGMKVDIASGGALVKGDSGTPAVGLSQGLFLGVNDASVANAVTLNASDGTNPRIDQIVLKVRDSSDLGTGADDLTFDKVSGTATSGATLDNRTGAGALPNDCLRLADVLVPAGSSATSAGNIRDRRPWARGALSRIKRTSADYTTASTSFVDVDGTNLVMRIECSGVPIRFGMSGRLFNQTGNCGVQLRMNMDGAHMDAATGVSYSYVAGYDAGAMRYFDWLYAPAAGTHLFKPQYMVAVGGTALLAATGNNSLAFTIEELVRQDAHNGTS